MSSALCFDARLLGLIAFEQTCYQDGAQWLGELREQVLCVGSLVVHSESHAQAKFGVVFTERVRPGWTTALTIYGVRSCRQVSAVNGRAARRIGDEETVTKELREKLDVGRFATAGAGAREFKERLKKLSVFHLSMGEALAVEFQEGKEKLPIGCFSLAKRSLHLHVDGFVFHFAFTLGGQISTHRRQPVQSSGATCSV